MEKMNHYVLIIFLLFGLVGCCNNHMKKIDREEESTIFVTDDNDEEMNTAIKTAKQTFEKFETALNSKNKEFDNFFLKICFDTQEGNEHIWIGEITIKDNEYYGVVVNLPEHIKDICFGDKIQINKNNISDWMYTDDKKLMGGFTIRLIRNRMNEVDRKQFDIETGLIFDE